MQRTTVKSTALKSVGYDEASQTLEVEFHSGDVYAFSDVPLAAHQDLMSAESHGKQFQSIMRAAYPAQKLVPVKEDA